MAVKPLRSCKPIERLSAWPVICADFVSTNFAFGIWHGHVVMMKGGVRRTRRVKGGREGVAMEGSERPRQLNWQSGESSLFMRCLDVS